MNETPNWLLGENFLNSPLFSRGISNLSPPNEKIP
jgi:hypothetical protein